MLWGKYTRKTNMSVLQRANDKDRLRQVRLQLVLGLWPLRKGKPKKSFTCPHSKQPCVYQGQLFETYNRLHESLDELKKILNSFVE